MVPNDTFQTVEVLDEFEVEKVDNFGPSCIFTSDESEPKWPELARAEGFSARLKNLKIGIFC
jgi:hypothetical protein